ncbi:MAG: class I SAM-dependent methyltransferase [Vicinamibacterales bacterium]
MGLASWFRPRPPVLAPKDAYARWAPTYASTPHNALMAAEQAAVLAAWPDVAGQRVLDAGCGTGRYLDAAAARGAACVVGVDFSPEMLARVTVPAAHRLLGDLGALPVATASVDLVVSGLALNDVPDLAQAIAELARVLRPRGTLVYSVVHPRGGELGWTRGFTGEGGEAIVRGCWHTVAEHERACVSARLLVDLQQDVASPGSPDGGPVALVVRARKAA